MNIRLILLITVLGCFCPISKLISQENRCPSDTVFSRGYLEFRQEHTIQGHEQPSWVSGYGTVYFGVDKKLKRYILNYYHQDSMQYVNAAYDDEGDLKHIWFKIEEKDKPLIQGSVTRDQTKPNPVFFNYEIQSEDSLQSGIVKQQAKVLPRRILHWKFSDYITVDNLLKLWRGETIKPLPFPYKVKFRRVKEGDVTYITANGVGVREEPNVNSRVREAWSTGYRFRIEEVMQIDSIAPWGCHPWYKVRWERNADTEYGYIFGAFVDEVEEIVPSRIIKLTSFKNPKMFTDNARPGTLVKYHVETSGIPDGDSLRYRLKNSDGEVLKEYIITVKDNIAETPYFEVLEEWNGKLLRSTTREVFDE